ncbi:MAG: acetyltransferase [Ignavibacteriales bacterium]|jgi:sugar O-acyltransferase (sialic acid O-acetyltransferase NeuD family)|nr:acetyltransferase [Ignavibacteriales bacterium]
MKEKIVIIGGGGHAKVIASIIKKIGEFEIIGYTDEEDKGVILEFPFLGNDNQFLSNNFQNIKCAAIGIGQIKSSALRKKVVDQYKNAGFHFPIIISPYAIVNENVGIGEGTVIFDGAVINTYSSIGSFVIINTNSTVEHDCNIGDFVHLASNSVLSGNVIIGNGTFIGAGATIIQGIEIEHDVIIGAGSTATKNCFAGKTYIGVPAKLL